MPKRTKREISATILEGPVARYSIGGEYWVRGLRIRVKKKRVCQVSALTDEEMERAGYAGRNDLRMRRPELGGDDIVSVLLFDVIVPARFMTRPGPGHGDYTQDPSRAIDHLEVVESVYLDTYSEEAEAKRSEAKAEAAKALDEMPLHQRLRLLEERSRTADLSSHKRVIQSRLVAMERAVGLR